MSKPPGNDDTVEAAPVRQVRAASPGGPTRTDGMPASSTGMTNGRGKVGRIKMSGLLFALPQLVLWLVFVVFPIGCGGYISLHRWHVLAHQHPFTGLANYSAAISDDLFWQAFWNTAYFAALVVPFGNVVSLLLALGLWTVRRFGTFYRTTFYAPVVISIAVVAVLWRWLYNTELGLVNATLTAIVGQLRSLGLPLPPFHPIPWLSEVRLVMPALAIMTIWWTAGGNMIFYLAGLQGIPDSYYEAARIDGAGTWRQFVAITWPLLRPTTLFCLVFSLLASFQVFGQSYVIYAPDSGPGRSALTLVYYMYQQGFSQYEIGYGAAIAYLLFAIVLAFTLIQFRLFAREERAANQSRGR